MAPTPLRIAVIGVSSLIGDAVIDELRTRKFPFTELHLLDDARNVGTPIADDDKPLAVNDVAAFDFSSVSLVFFCGRGALSERYAEAAAAHAWVIDGSAAFRGRPGVPLVAVDVNPQALDAVGAQGLIALPGSASVALATALAPLHALAGLARRPGPAGACHQRDGRARTRIFRPQSGGPCIVRACIERRRGKRGAATGQWHQCHRSGLECAISDARHIGNRTR